MNHNGISFIKYWDVNSFEVEECCEIENSWSIWVQTKNLVDESNSCHFKKGVDPSNYKKDKSAFFNDPFKNFSPFFDNYELQALPKF